MDLQLTGKTAVVTGASMGTRPGNRQVARGRGCHCFRRIAHRRNQMSGELFKMLAGVNLVHVPYRGAGPALPDLISGQVQVMFVAITSSIEYIKAERLRALGVTTTTRSEALPDVPTIADFVPGYEDSNWWGFGAPKATPAAIVDKLNQETNAALADPRIKARLAELGGTVLAGSPADFGKLIAAETEKWAKVVKFAGIKPD
jgi:tripartite-type tricarboxylate transporter receptor subunit TctC